MNKAERALRGVEQGRKILPNGYQLYSQEIEGIVKKNGTQDLLTNIMDFYAWGFLRGMRAAKQKKGDRV